MRVPVFLASPDFPGSEPSEAYIENGVVRWKSNDRVPFDDMLEANPDVVSPEVRAKSAAARKADNDAFFAEYRKNPPVPSPEDMAEMRNAFGPGTVVMNVITGRRYRV